MDEANSFAKKVIELKLPDSKTVCCFCGSKADYQTSIWKSCLEHVDGLTKICEQLNAVELPAMEFNVLFQGKIDSGWRIKSLHKVVNQTHILKMEKMGYQKLVPLGLLPHWQNKCSKIL